MIIFCVDPDVAGSTTRIEEKSPSPFTSGLSEYSIAKPGLLVLESLHVTVIEESVMVVGLFRVGCVREPGVTPSPVVVALSIEDHALLLVESVEEIARI